MASLRERLLVRPGAEVRLDKIDPEATPGCEAKDEGLERFAAHGDRLSVLQYLLYAEAKRSVLVILQGIDAGGKDGTIRKVMSGMNPQGVHVTSFKAPAGVEKEHDYLWRVHAAVPRFGQIGIFNRSHYEDVLIARVRGLVEEKVWSRRYDHINAFEQMLADEGTTILKFFLYISKDEQKKRFEERINDPEKHWKFNPADIEERKYWDAYIKAYEVAIEHSSKPHAPWYIIPANRKWYRNLAVAEILRETLEDMNIQYPGPIQDLSRIKFE